MTIILDQGVVPPELTEGNNDGSACSVVASITSHVGGGAGVELGAVAKFITVSSLVVSLVVLILQITTENDKIGKNNFFVEYLEQLKLKTRNRCNKT